MSHSYFVSPPEPTGWRISPESFVAALRAHWPNVRIISETPNNYRSVAFELDMPHSMADAYLSASGAAVVLDADIKDVAELAVWFRSLVPDSVPLVLFDEGYTVKVPVTRSSTAQELAAPFLSEP